MNNDIKRAGNKITGAILILAGILGISALSSISNIVGGLILILGFCFLFYYDPRKEETP